MHRSGSALCVLVLEAVAPHDRVWPVYAEDAGSMHYSTLSATNVRNVAELNLAWQCKTGEGPPQA